MRAGSRFRARPIDVNKKIAIHYGGNYQYEDEIAALSGATIDATALDEGGEQLVQAIRMAAFDERNKMLGQQVIPTPHFEQCRAVHVSHFRRPSQYIREPARDLDEFDSQKVEYDLESDDERFLEQQAGKGHSIDEDTLERCIDRLEKETGRLRAIKDAKDALAPPGCVALGSDGLDLRPVELQAVYDHWVNKRRRFGKALNRRFTEPPEMNDPDPNVAFRPRHKSFTRTRRRNDLTSFFKMKEIRQGLERLQMILELIKRRERAKEDDVDLLYALFLSKLARIKRVSSRQHHGSPHNHHNHYHHLYHQHMSPSGERHSNRVPKLSARGRAYSRHKFLEDSSSGMDSDSSLDDEMDLSQSPYGADVAPSVPQPPRSHKKKRPVEAVAPQPHPDSFHHVPIRPPPPRALCIARYGRGGRVLLNRRLLHQHCTKRLLFTLVPQEVPFGFPPREAPSGPHVNDSPDNQTEPSYVSSPVTIPHTEKPQRLD